LLRSELELFYHHRLKDLFDDNSEIKTYSLKDANADYYASHIVLKESCYHFDLNAPHLVIKNIKLAMPGLINLENAVAAAASALEAGVETEDIKNALASFLGIKRRMELIVKTHDAIYYDDYAHHPEEIKAALSSLKALYPNQKLTVVFQPHLYSRTRDFAQGFAESLSLADEVILLEIYPAREEPMLGVNSDLILKDIKTAKKQLLAKEELVDYITELQPELLVTLGAGDIDRFVEPIKNIWL
jgi:UDP-N-acetylmuramate--alanine ligase